MAIDFPSSPTLGQVYTYAGITYTYTAEGVWASVGNSPAFATQIPYRYTISVAGTTVTGYDDLGRALTYFPGYVAVYANGVKLIDTLDYVATSGSSVVFVTAVQIGDVVEIIAYGTYAFATSATNTVMVNGTLVISAASSALTIALKTLAGADPSFADPISIVFPVSTGGYSVLSITAATSLVISSGSTLGVPSSTAFRIWIVGFNDAGTFRLGAVNCTTLITRRLIQFPLQNGVFSSTVEGGAGAADSAQIIYTGTAVTSKPMRILGYAEWNATGLTAGTWTTTNLATVQLFGPGIPLPGDVIQTKTFYTSSQSTTASATFVATGTALAIVPSSACNPLDVSSIGTCYVEGAAPVDGYTIIRRAAVIISPMIETFTQASGLAASVCMRGYDIPNTISSVTYTVFFKLAIGTAIYYPATAGSSDTDMVIKEIMA